jgi:hypothetical protein
VPEP